MKKLLTLLLTLGLLFTLSSPVFASSDVKINANGNILKDAQAVIQNGSTLLPVRSVSNAFGCEVDWNGDTKTVSINKDDTQITIVIGQKELTVNDTKQSISAPAQIINGRTYVPLRALGEALDCEIQWVNDTRTVEITPNDPAEYKAWYEVDENGNLYIKTNISSRKWNGYCAIICYNMKDKNNNKFSRIHIPGGDGIVESPYSSVIFAYQPPNDISTVESTEIYIFKGMFSADEFWRLADKLGNYRKALDAMSERIIYQTVLFDTITFQESTQQITFKKLNINCNKEKGTETYTAFIETGVKDYGQYVLTCRGDNISHGNMFLEKNDNKLYATNDQINYFAPSGTMGSFYMVHCTYSINNAGNIICEKAISNRLNYQIP